MTTQSSAPPGGPWAHSANANGEWHDLREHLEAVASLARKFAEPFGAGDWAERAGLWHDLGKYSTAFQEYLASDTSVDTHEAEARARVDHSTAGAQHSVQAIPITGHLLAYVIAGHHAGLLDGRADGPSLEARLTKAVAAWSGCPPMLLTTPEGCLPPLVGRHIAARNGFGVAFFVRLLYSCLVDADFLDTEGFLDPQRAAQRPRFPDDTLGMLARGLDSFVRDLEARASVSPVNRERAAVYQHCLTAARLHPGFFSLTVPTGGGKTLSSLAFALQHALSHGLRRIIYVVPFTSIIEQNADVFRAVFAPLRSKGLPDVVVEHHSALDAGEETTASRLASENWDAPLIVTTSVQFYESLFANRASRCRKLHNLVGSVVVLDEAQTLPVDYLEPCLRALSELATNYGSTILLCTATQPAIQRREDFLIGLEGAREIIPEPRNLYLKLRRTRTEDLGAQLDQELAARLRQEPQVLCVVNTRGHARKLFEVLGDDPSHFHLSALMCPAHRSAVFAGFRTRLDSGEPCRVVSTQLVEAGVDIDFPVVFRAMTGLDSIAQAAGRCNRHGTLPDVGRTYIFRSEHRSSERFLRDTADAAEQVLRLYSDPLDLEAVERYFKLYYWDQSARWDEKHVLSEFHLLQDRRLPFQLGFATVASRFRLIEDAGKPVIVPWGVDGQALCRELMGSPRPDRILVRQLQRFTVTIPPRLWHEHLGRSIALVHGQYPILRSPEAQYSERLGLILDGGHMPYLEL